MVVPCVTIQSISKNRSMYGGRKNQKITKDKADNSRGRKKEELTQAYKSYADYKFPNNETCHPRFRNAAYSVLFTPTNDECQFNN